MAKILICDICKKEGKITESKTYYRVSGRKDLRIDYCPACKNKIPKKMTEYVKFAYSLHDINLNDEELQRILEGIRQ